MRKSTPPINITNFDALARHAPGVGYTPQAMRDKAARLIVSIATMSARARQRRDLAALDARQLRDIGVSRTQARDEAEKPFWRA